MIPTISIIAETISRIQKLSKQRVGEIICSTPILEIKYISDIDLLAHLLEYEKKLLKEINEGLKK